MEKHDQRDRGYRESYGRKDDRDPRKAGGSVDDAQSRLPRKLPMALVLVGLAVWSLLAGVGYTLVDPVLDWVASNGGLLIDSGKGLATVTGAGKEIGNVVDNLNVSGLLGQAIALLKVVMKPAIIVIWAIGAFVLIAASLILSKVGRLLGGRR